jgi:four helix bundle protein
MGLQASGSRLQAPGFRLWCRRVSRDPAKLKVFAMADDLVERVYRATSGFPPEERYGLQAQIQREAVSVPTNIVEGSARRSTRDYLHFLTVALGSASEARYLIGLAHRLDMMHAEDHDLLAARYGDLLRAMEQLIAALDQRT